MLQNWVSCALAAPAIHQSCRDPIEIRLKSKSFGRAVGRQHYADVDPQRGEPAAEQPRAGHPRL
ncbi:MAG: hypothetical protein ACT4PP_09645 [Sporichthyaceae bacterium]